MTNILYLYLIASNIMISLLLILIIIGGIINYNANKERKQRIEGDKNFVLMRLPKDVFKKIFENKDDNDDWWRGREESR